MSPFSRKQVYGGEIDDEGDKLFRDLEQTGDLSETFHFSFPLCRHF
jgi:hypothetical protein